MHRYLPSDGRDLVYFWQVLSTARWRVAVIGSNGLIQRGRTFWLGLLDRWFQLELPLF